MMYTKSLSLYKKLEKYTKNRANPHQKKRISSCQPNNKFNSPQILPLRQKTIHSYPKKQALTGSLQTSIQMTILWVLLNAPNAKILIWATHLISNQSARPTEKDMNQSESSRPLSLDNQHPRNQNDGKNQHLAKPTHLIPQSTKGKEPSNSQLRPCKTRKNDGENLF